MSRDAVSNCFRTLVEIGSLDIAKNLCRSLRDRACLIENLEQVSADIKILGHDLEMACLAVFAGCRIGERRLRKRSKEQCAQRDVQC